MKNLYFVFAGIAVILLVVGYVVVNNREKPEKTSDTARVNTVEVTSTSDTSSAASSEKTLSFSGEKLAGTSSPFYVFKKEDYEIAKATKRIILLDFYANWCPECRAEAPVLHTGFDELKIDNFVGFRVNYKDNETSSDEEALAKEFSVPYQHTKVILKDGKQILKDTKVWNATAFNAAIAKALE